MLRLNRQKSLRILFIAAGSFMALQYFDPFTVKSVENIVFKGERLSQVYHFVDDVKTGSIKDASQVEEE